MITFLVEVHSVLTPGVEISDQLDQRTDVQAGMRRQRLRVELRLDGELQACYQGRYLAIAECGARIEVIQPKASKPARKDHNAGDVATGWMDSSTVPARRFGG
jgi:hypothetical protein